MLRLLSSILLLAASPAWAVDHVGFDPAGASHRGHVRVSSLYPGHDVENSATKAMSCTVLRDGTFEPLGNCARSVADGSYLVAAAALRQLDFDRWGLAPIAIRGVGYAYVRRNGRALVVPTFDNAPDEFIDGLVRVRIGEKLGYANRRLKVVIPAIYDGAYRFGNGRAWACIGCVSVSDGEHSWYREGQAICIDRSGTKRPQTECGQAGWLLPQLRE